MAIALAFKSLKDGHYCRLLTSEAKWAIDFVNAPVTSESSINSRESRTLQYTATAQPFYKYCAEMKTATCDVMLYNLAARHRGFVTILKPSRNPPNYTVSHAGDSSLHSHCHASHFLYLPDMTERQWRWRSKIKVLQNTRVAGSVCKSL